MALEVEGTVFTVGKTNANGWAIPDEEVGNALSSLKEAVVRVCNSRDEHACDREGSRWDEIGRVIDAWREGDAVKARALITDSTAARKLKEGTWRPTWSLFGTGRVEDGTVHNLNIESLTVVRKPAYKEAEFMLAGSEEKLSIGEDVGASAVPTHHTPQIDEGAWDADAAVLALRKWASRDGSGDKEQMDWAKYRKGFAWYDAENPDNFGSYKLPHHTVVGGDLVLSRRGLFAAMAAFRGARGGVDIPRADREGVYRHLAMHYKDLQLEPPALAASESEKETEGEQMVENETPAKGEEVIQATEQPVEAAKEPVYTKEQVDEMLAAAAEKAKAETLEHLTKEQHATAIVEAMQKAGALKSEEAEGRKEQLMEMPVDVLATELASWQRAVDTIEAASKLDRASLADVGASGLTLGRWNNDTKQWEA
ncbi:MAG: hypothetical protein ACXQT3_02860 [Methermicoccaceae archaeon]